MPASHLRNRKQQQQNGTQNGAKKSHHQNGFNNSQHQQQQIISNVDEEKVINKKLTIHSEEDEDNNNNNDNCAKIKNINVKGTEVNSDADEYSDMVGPRAGMMKERPIVVEADVETSIGRSAKDQFADALLRLQADLDKASGRLNAIESKVDQMAQRDKSNSKRQVRINENKHERAAAKRILSQKNLARLFYIGWPVLVYVALRALERRRSRTLTNK